MWNKKRQGVARSRAINLEPQLSLDSFRGQHAISKTDDSEHWLWCVIDLIIDMPKLALISLMRSIRRRISERRRGHDKANTKA